MSKNHKKRYRALAELSTPNEKPSPETKKSEEPIKLERVLLSDDFYWEVPGDVPASNRRFGMKMVPPGIPKSSTSTETSTPSSSMSNRTEEVDTSSATETKEAVDTIIQARNNTTDQVKNNTGAPVVAENKVNVDIFPQDQKDTAERAEDSVSRTVKTVTEIKPDFVASNRNQDTVTTPTTESKTKVAASILPLSDTRTDTTRLDTTLNAAPAAATIAEAKGDNSQQETVIANKKIEHEEAIPSKLRYLEENDQGSGGRSRRAWLALPLLLLVGSVLYSALNNDENMLPPVDEINTDDIVKTSVSDQLQVTEEAVVANAEVAQAKPVYLITHVVVKGDTLWDISEKYHNDPFRYPELAESSNIKNPDLIYPGDIITIATNQAVDNTVQAQISNKSVVASLETSQLTPVGFITHVVVIGDTLWAISKKYLNNPFRYPEVAKLSEIKNPDLIYPGDIVRIQI